MFPVRTVTPQQASLDHVMDTCYFIKYVRICDELFH